MACSSVFLGAAFCQVEIYRRTNQRMFLAISKAIAVQQIGLLPLGQPFQAIVQFPARFLSSIMVCGCMA